uniref:RNA-directed DNA polymerase, eukaryota n=1 Tax=Tanacetum cinerariifolium TaxID=118510 RepID=A0A699JPY3_TANCI|nr:hypothetical protein [Tanacetum cinerariifolium]
MSNYFIMVRGVLRQNGKDFLIIVVYAPHDIKEKMMLWDYLKREIGRWKGGGCYGAGLVEVSLGGCSLTWCHKSATKMSKLDRFLVSESLLNTCPNISAITLERYLSDHRPILLRSIILIMESPSDKSNVMIRMMGKLKFLKTKIWEWNKTNMLWRNNVKAQCKADFEAVEVIIDSGNGNKEIAIKRTKLAKNPQHIDKLNSLEIAQKDKVKWAIE